ncbi:MAG: hypothetical protein RL219_389 [Actinomycetota bacterium]
MAPRVLTRPARPVAWEGSRPLRGPTRSEQRIARGVRGPTHRRTASIGVRIVLEQARQIGIVPTRGSAHRFTVAPVGSCARRARIRRRRRARRPPRLHPRIDARVTRPRARRPIARIVTPGRALGATGLRRSGTGATRGTLGRTADEDRLGAGTCPTPVLIAEPQQAGREEHEHHHDEVDEPRRRTVAHRGTLGNGLAPGSLPPHHPRIVADRRGAGASLAPMGRRR